MTSTNIFPDIQKHIPIMGDMTLKSPMAYKATRLMTGVFNATQMALAEAYINGLEIPDSVFRSLMHTSMPILFQHAPGLLAPYEWVLKESDRLAESSQELMKVQYDLPQAMLNRMLGDWQIIYPKYSMGFWEHGAADLEESQMHMIDQVIERLEITDGDHILDFGCGWGCVPNYIMSKFPNVRFTGLNLSHEQCEYMRHKMQDPESYLSSGRFTLHEGDLNEVQFAEKFDKILSIGVLCHIGNMTKSLEKISSFLKENGKVFIHIISTHLPHNMFNPFIDKYIFPRARIWHYDVIPNCDRDLKTINKWFINGSNYSRTLQAWLSNFDQSQDKIKNLNYGMEYAQFRRIWRLYLLLCIAYFDVCEGEIMGNGQYLMVHRA